MIAYIQNIIQNSDSIFNFSYLTISSLSILLLLTSLICIYLIARRVKKTSSLIRLFLYSCCIIAFYLLLIQPKNKVQLNSKKAIFITSQISDSTINFILDTLNKETLIGTNQIELKENISHFKSLHLFLESDSLINDVLIYGNSLPIEELKLLAYYNIRYLESPLNSFIQTLNWDKEINYSDTLKIFGTVYQASKKKELKLFLKGSRGIIDSIGLGKNPSNFHFLEVPPTSGRHLFSLELYSQDSLISKTKIPTTVLPSKDKNAILLFNQANFETRFLKKWLAENDWSYLLQFKTSKTKTRFETHNWQGEKANSISNSILKRTQLIITDLSTINSFSDIEFKKIANAVRNWGLNIVVQMDTETSATNTKTPFKTNTNSQQIKELILIKGQASSTKIKLPKLSLLKTNNLFEKEIAETTNGQTLAISVPKGIGKWTANTLINSYFWQLSGDSISYDNYWNNLTLNNSADNTLNQSWNIKGNYAIQNLKNTIILNTNKKTQVWKITNPKGETIKLAPSPHLNNPSSIQTSDYWPEYTGWHSIECDDEATYNFYVHSQNEFKNQLEFRARNKINLFIKNNFEKTNILNKYDNTPYPLWPYFILLIFGLAGLWIEEKFR